MIKVYVAGPWADKEDAKDVANALRERGIEVTSRWHDTTHKSNIYEAPAPIMQAEAEKDRADLDKANTLVLLNLSKSEGKATELGISLQRNLRILVLGGKQNNVFLHLPQVEHFDDLEQVIQELLRG